MAEYPPETLAAADQMSAEMQDRGMRLVREALDRQGLAMTEEREMVLGIGVGAGVAVAMQVLLERGLIGPGAHGG